MSFISRSNGLTDVTWSLSSVECDVWQRRHLARRFWNHVLTCIEIKTMWVNHESVYRSDVGHWGSDQPVCLSVSIVRPIVFDLRAKDIYGWRIDVPDSAFAAVWIALDHLSVWNHIQVESIRCMDANKMAKDSAMLRNKSNAWYVRYSRDQFQSMWSLMRYKFQFFSSINVIDTIAIDFVPFTRFIQIVAKQFKSMRWNNFNSST